MDLPIAPEALAKPKLLNKVFDTEPQRNFFIRAKNCVLSNYFTPAAIKTITEEYGDDFYPDFRDDILALLQDIICHFAHDGRFDTDERQFVRDYVSAFTVPKSDARRAQMKATHKAFAGIAARMIRDEELSDTELGGLRAIGQRFGFSEEYSDEQFVKVAKDKAEEYLNAMLDDGLVSDQEWDDFVMLCKGLRIGVLNKAELEQEIAFARTRWRVLYGDMQSTVPLNIKLKTGEHAYFVGTADWYETRKVNVHVTYSGSTARIRVAEDIHYRAGSLRYNMPTVEQMMLIRSGELILTNKRMILVSDTGDNRSINWTTVSACPCRVAESL